MEILSEGRKRGDELNELQRRFECAESPHDILERHPQSEPISLDEVTQHIADGLAKKALRYGDATCSKLDALVYVNLTGRHLWPRPKEFSLDAEVANELSRQGWRSVSTVVGVHGAILMAQPAAPDFLREREGRILAECPHDEVWE